ncbi:MAG: phosphate acyltransferase, partial [Alphaproteobacteria bacterium]
EFADGTVIGPVLQGLNHAVQITSMTAKVSDVLNAAVFAAIESARK